MPSTGRVCARAAGENARDAALAVAAAAAAGLSTRVTGAGHSFNLLDARRAISVTERQRYILRVRTLAMAVAKLYEAKRIEAVAAKEVQA